MNSTQIPSHQALGINLEETGRDVEEALSECDRELQVRDRCFARWVGEGKITSVDARDRMQRLARACQILQAVMHLSDTQLAQMESHRDREAKVNQD